MIIYNCKGDTNKKKGGKQVSKHKKKKPTIEWKTQIISAIVDLIIGIILLIIQKILF